MKKKIIVALVLLLSLFCCACGSQSVQLPAATVSFTVVDGLSGLPVEGVRIVLPENDVDAFTDGNGQTAELPVKVQCRTDSVVSTDTGDFTVLGFKEGYHDYALFYAKIREGQNRKIKLYLFRDGSGEDSAPLSTVEAPDREQVEELIKKYK